jgi:hypothetical protein
MLSNTEVIHIETQIFSYRSRTDEQSTVILIGHIPCLTMGKLTLRSVLILTIVLRQTQLDLALRAVGITSQYDAVSMPAFMCNILCHCVKWVWFLRNTRFLR